MRLILLSILSLVCSGCATSVLWTRATKTYTNEYIPTENINDIHAFINGSKVVVQYHAVLMCEKEGENYPHEAEYNLNNAVPLEMLGDNIYLIGPACYSTKHHDYSIENNWEQLIVKYDYSEFKIPYSNYFYNVSSNTCYETAIEYRGMIKQVREDRPFLEKLINKMDSNATYLQVSILPKERSSARAFDFDRGIVFSKFNKDKQKLYVMMIPCYKTTYGHEAKLLFVLLPATLAFDIITFPIQFGLFVLCMPLRGIN